MDSLKVNKSQIGQRIQNLRQQNNLSMETLASKVGASGKSTVNEWEKGRSTPNREYLAKLSNFFGVSEDYIKFGSYKQYVYQLYLSEINISDSQLKTIVEHYLDISTNFHGLMESLYINEKFNDADSVYKQYIDNAFEDNYQLISDHLTKDNIRYEDERIIKVLSSTFAELSVKQERAFEGKASALMNYLSDFDIFSFSPANSFEEYLKDTQNSPIEKTTKDKLEGYYDAKLGELVMKMNEQVSELKFNYEMDKDKYLSNEES